MSRTPRRLLALAGFAVFASPTMAQSRMPHDGTEVFARMSKAYAHGWFTTLTFSQTTTIRLRDGRDTVQTWFETLRFTPELGTRIRIDVAPLAAGNATISTWDSTWVLRGGALSATRGDGNPFLPLVMGAYLQAPERTAREVAPLGVDLSKIHAAVWNDRVAWVVGAANPCDSTSAQFWVDAERLLVVRMVLAAGAGRPPLDIRLDKFMPVGKGWLATRVEMTSGGQRRQLEEYHDWKGNVGIDVALMDPARSATAKHWAKR
ncbi:MAG: hypothetical protein ACYC3L_12215 [Gemmatimonadaceae bacterium]